MTNSGREIPSFLNCPLLNGFGGVLSTCSEPGADANKIIIYRKPPFAPIENLVIPLDDKEIESQMKNACENCKERDYHNPKFRMMRVLMTQTSDTIRNSNLIGDKEPVDTMVAVFPFILDSKY